MRMYMKKRSKDIPVITDDVYEDMEMLIRQAEMTSGAARNTVDDMCGVASELLTPYIMSLLKNMCFGK